MNSFGRIVTRFSLDHPRSVVAGMIVLTVLLGALAALPTVWAPAAGWLHPATVDTDPENMLAEDEPVRVFHDRMKQQFNLYDMIVVGVVNDDHPEGVFNVESLRRIYELTEYARTLKGEAIGLSDDPEAGVVGVDLIAPSTVDNIEQGGLGVVKFEWLMPKPPATAEAALAVRDKAQNIPFLSGTLVSDDGKALAIYLPLTSKDLAHQVSLALQDKIDSFDGADAFHITGLPVAEDTFGVEMFKQMAISAPTAMFVIFILMWIFFRKLPLIVPPLIMAAVTAIMTMALLVISGKTIHIMSSMIPIFIMPIAVLDAIHIISDFFDRYPRTRDRRQTMMDVMDELFAPMLFTSLTTTAGFASLALTPIPPVQVFGVFVGVGVMLAWFWTITFIPAAIMLIREQKLASLARASGDEASASHVETSPMSRLLAGIGRFTAGRPTVIVGLTVVVIAVSVYGISRININDNPTKWFEADHPIRVADRVLNAHFGGTYMAYLELEPGSAVQEMPTGGFADRARAKASELAAAGVPNAEAVFDELVAYHAGLDKPTFETLIAHADAKASDAPDDRYEAWNEAALMLANEQQANQVFKQPEALRYIAELQQFLTTIKTESGEPLVGKSNSLADIVKTVHRELLGGTKDQFRIPDNPRIVAETLIQYQNSHRPQDLDKFITRDEGDAEAHFRRTNLWLQLHSGDNRDMSAVEKQVAGYMRTYPPPFDLKANWFGLTYINVVWQDKMVSGMLQAFLGSFLVVLFMMIVLFRSALWGLLSMIPLTVTVGLIYGLIGLVGKDYDMPVAVLSSLSLGLAIDYAIHFLARSRNAVAERGSWREAVGYVFGEPARAITRNAIVVGVGFAPLLLAPLTPYQTVGVFIAMILITAGAATLLILPALISLLEPWLFPRSSSAAFTCNCGTCIISGVVLVGLVAVNIHQFLHAEYTQLTWWSLAAIPLIALICWSMSRRSACSTSAEPSVQGVSS